MLNLRIWIRIRNDLDPYKGYMRYSLTLVVCEAVGLGVTRTRRKKMVPSLTSSFTSSPRAVTVPSNLILTAGYTRWGFYLNIELVLVHKGHCLWATSGPQRGDTRKLESQKWHILAWTILHSNLQYATLVTHRQRQWPCIHTRYNFYTLSTCFFQLLPLKTHTKQTCTQICPMEKDDQDNLWRKLLLFVYFRQIYAT